VFSLETDAASGNYKTNELWRGLPSKRRWHPQKRLMLLRISCWKTKVNGFDALLVANVQEEMSRPT